MLQVVNFYRAIVSARCAMRARRARAGGGCGRCSSSRQDCRVAVAAATPSGTSCKPSMASDRPTSTAATCPPVLSCPWTPPDRASIGSFPSPLQTNQLHSFFNCFEEQEITCFYLVYMEYFIRFVHTFYFRLTYSS